jgi:hypothetical protein
MAGVFRIVRVADGAPEPEIQLLFRITFCEWTAWMTTKGIEKIAGVLDVDC